MNKKTFVVILLVIFLVSYGISIVTPLIPIYMREMGASGFILGAIFSGFSFSRLVFMPIIGKLSDKNGRKVFIVTGLGGYTVISLLYVIAKTPLQLVLIRVFHGFFSAMVFPVVMAYVGDRTTKGREGRTMGTLNSAVFMGMAGGPLLGGVVKDIFDMKHVFYLMTAMVGIGMLLTLFFLPEHRDIRMEKSCELAEDGGNVFSLYLKAMKDRIVLGIFLFRMSYAMLRASLLSFLPVFASNLSFSSSEIGVLVSLNVVFSALFQRTFGKFADRHNRYRMVLFGMLLGAVFVMVLPFLGNKMLLFIISALLGLTGAVSIPAATAIVVKVGNKYGMGFSMGLFNMAMSLGMIIAPLFLGFIMDLLRVDYVFIISGIITFLMAGAYFFMLRKELTRR
ncbi:MAG TPA: MFS transporter [Candidatus Marinimicrobia bacterium]|nr:MFS transporter [Candidatus Neomarinimicrobiota bacterium]